VELRSEELLFNLTLAGRPAGSQRLSTTFERGLFVMRLEASFQGGLGARKSSQVSRLEPESRFPTSFLENDNGRVFETVFDRREGLVKVRQNRDEASIALTQDYQDPVSILQYLRDLSDEVRSARVPMIGGTVLVTRLEDQTLDTPWGPLLARVYYLRPGVSFVYIEASAPHRILKLTQSLGKSALEATLSRVSEGVQVRLDEREAFIRSELRSERRGFEPAARRGHEPVQRRGNEPRARRTDRQQSERQPDRPEALRDSRKPSVQLEVDSLMPQQTRSKRRRRGRNKGVPLEQGSLQPIARVEVSAPKPALETGDRVGGADSGAVSGAASGATKKRRRRRRGGRSNGGNSES
jgi:hypothetical protein